jgi:integrase
VLVLVDTGLKRDERVSLRTDDVELPPDAPVPGRLRVRHRRATRRVRHRTLALTDRLVEALVPLLEAARARVDDTDGASVFGLSARGVDFVVETCGRRAGVRPDRKVTPQMLRDGYACTRMPSLLADESALSTDSRERRDLERENNRPLLRELGLSDRGAAAVRIRSLAHGLKLDRAEQP